MSLEKLFDDRRTRKYIKESIYEGSDLGIGYCTSCRSYSPLIKTFGVQLCEKCCDRLLNIAENYDVVLEGTDKLDVMSLLKEGIIIPDFEKVEKEANARFNGSVADLLKSYGIMLQYDGPDTFLQDGYMKLWKASLLPGNRANKFMIDFDGKYQSARGTLDPDSDGTQAPFVKASSADIDKNKKIVLSNPNWGGYLIGVFKHGVPVDDLAKKAMQAAGLSGKVSARQVSKGGSQSVSAVASQQTAQTAQTTANTNTVPTAPATPKVVGATSNSSSTVNNTATSKPVSAKGKAKVNFKFNTSGTEDNFTVDLSGLEITCTKASENGDVKTYDVSVKGGDSSQFVIDAKGANGDLNALTDKIVDDFVNNPEKIFPAFEGDGKVTKSNKYSIYQFTLDEYTFRDRVLSLATIFNGKTIQSKGGRVILTPRAFLSKASLQGELTKHMDSVLERNYPILFNGNNVVQTSVGKLVHTFNKILPNGDIQTYCPVGNLDFGAVFHADDDRLKSADKAKEAFLSSMFDNLDKIIPEWGSKTLSPKSNYNYELDTTYSDGRKFSVYANFDSSEFLNSGNLVFNMSVLDETSGEEQPKKFRQIIYRKAGTPLSKFMETEGTKIYTEFFGKSNMTDVMTQSAQDKMKSSAKKQSLFNKIASIFVKSHSNIKALGLLEVEVSIEVNNVGKVVSGNITLTDIYGDVADNAKDLQSKVKLESLIKYLKPVSAKDTRDGATVTYKITDIEEFSKDIDLMVIEGLIFEAFGITMVNESGRKVFYM